MSNTALPQGGFNASQFDPTQRQVGALPVGEQQLFAVVGVALEGAQSNSNNGVIKVDLRIDDGPNQGVVGRANFNVYHEDSKTAKIAADEFAAFCYVVGFGQQTLVDLQQLMGKVGRVSVTETLPREDGRKFTKQKWWYVDGAEPTKNGPKYSNGGQGSQGGQQQQNAGQQQNNGGQSQGNGGSWGDQNQGGGQQQGQQGNQGQQQGNQGGQNQGGSWGGNNGGNGGSWGNGGNNGGNGGSWGNR